ncbi:MAG TPA: chemotaxis protein CheW [Gemmatimonadaceae bacterium]|nr:chemotaxis protein CheW [Gemmatimonadaceae bacterium]
MNGTTERTQLVTFQAAAELFATDIFAVERVLRFAAPRMLPNAAPWLRGVIDHGGRTIPVVDLRERLSLPKAEADERARILVITVGDTLIGMTVDAVHEVVTVPTADIEPPPAIYRGLAKEYLRGVVRVDQRMFVVLDAGHLLGSTERIEMERAMRSAPGTEERDG